MIYKTLKTFNDLEQISADELKLVPTKGSGNVQNDGDSKGNNYGKETYGLALLECKFTEKEKKTVSFSKKDWEKTKASAYRYGRLPVMCTGDIAGEIFVHLSLDVFKSIYLDHITLINKYQEEEE